MSEKRKRSMKVLARMTYESRDAHHKNMRERRKVNAADRDAKVAQSLQNSKRASKLTTQLAKDVVAGRANLPPNHPFLPVRDVLFQWGQPLGRPEYTMIGDSYDGHLRKKREEDAYVRLVERLAELNPKVLSKSLSIRVTVPHVLRVIAKQESYWLRRDIENWKPKGRSESKILASLLRFLMAKYPIPVFFDSLYQHGCETRTGGRISVEERMLEFWPQVAQGANIRKLMECLTPLTKRMAHILMQTTGHVDFQAAVRRAQILGVGGSERLAKTLSKMQGRMVFQTDREEFTLSVFQWFANNPMIDPTQVEPLLDYIETLKRRDPEFKITGRSANRLYQGMLEWHRELHREGQYSDLPKVFTPSGHREGIFETLEQGHKILWEITEILNPKDLQAEGRRMRHCVFSYAGSIKTGRISIWRMTRFREMLNETERCVTIEVSARSNSIVQVRGAKNRMPTAEERRILRQWALQNSLNYR